MDVTSPAEQLFFTTVRIDTEDNDGNNGSGTGFVLQHKINEKVYPFIVSNKHVVKNMKKGSVTFLKGDDTGAPLLGDAYHLNIEDFSDHWYGHESENMDIAITPLAPLEKFINDQGVKIFYRSISSDLVPDENALKEIDAIEQIVFIGYPNGIWDQKNYTPISRTGTTATPIALDFEGEKKFLIDASVFGGSSGSPVFIFNTGMYATKIGPTKVGTRLHFVGVIASVFYKNDLNEIVAVPIPTENKPMAKSKEMIDLGIVFKAEAVIEVVEKFVNEKGS